MNITIHEQCLGDAVDAAAAEDGGQIGWVFENETVSFTQMRERSDTVAKALLAEGVQPGDVVAAWCPNLVEFAALQFACAKVGAIVSSVNTRFRSFELEYILRKGEVRLLIMVERFLKHDYVQTLADLGIAPGGHGDVAAAAFPKLTRLVSLANEPAAGMLSWTDFLVRGASVSDAALAERQVARHWKEPLILQYTSGTTAFPKGALLNHRYVLNVGNTLFKCMGVLPGEAILNTQPFYHIGGSCGAIPTPLTTRARVVVPEYYQAERVLQLIERERCVARTGFAAMYIMEMTLPNFADYDISSLRVGWCGGSAETLAKIREVMKMPYLMMTYSSTEVGGTSSLYTDSWEQRSTTVGRPLPGTELRILDPETGRTSPAGEAGEILMRGWWQMNEYMGQLEQTAKAVDAEGWMHTGDRGFVDADGCLHFLGRYKDMLKVGGENVSAEEVESHLLTHPAIKQAAVIGAPDARLDEVPMAIVELADGAELSEAAVIAYCAATMANFRVPKYVHFITDWPMTGSGKILKTTLREIYADPMRNPPAKAAAG